MKTQYYTAASLDGFIADARNSLDWLFQFGDVENGSYPDFIRRVGAIAMGSTTYEWILNHHINQEADRPQAWAYQQPTWVFTSRILPAVQGADIRFVKGDVRPVHQEMLAVAGDKNIWLVGGGDLVGQLPPFSKGGWGDSTIGAQRGLLKVIMPIRNHSESPVACPLVELTLGLCSLSPKVCRPASLSVCPSLLPLRPGLPLEARDDRITRNG